MVFYWFLGFFLAHYTPIQQDGYVLYGGKPVVHIVFKSQERAFSSDIQSQWKSLIEIDLNTTLTPQKIHRAIQRLYALDIFEQIIFSVDDNKKGLTLYIDTIPQLRLYKLHIKKNRIIHTDVLKEHIGLRPYDKITKDIKIKIKSKITQALQERGFFAPKVDIIEEITPYGVSISCFVEEGPYTRIRNIGFVGDVKIPRKHLLSVLQNQPGSRVNFQLLKQDMQNIQRSYQEHGFLNMELPTWEVLHYPGNYIDLNIRIQSGKKYIIQLKGDRILTKEELQKELKDLLKYGSSDPLEALNSHLKQKIQEKGYPWVEISHTTDKQHASKNFHHEDFQIKKHTLFYVQDILFRGNHIFSTNFLKQKVKSFLKSRQPDISIFTEVKNPEEISYTPTHVVSSLNQGIRYTHRFLPYLYQEALEHIRFLYQERGYHEVAIHLENVPSLYLDPNTSSQSIQSIFPAFVIQENPISYLKNVKITCFKCKRRLIKEEIRNIIQQQFPQIKIKKNYPFPMPERLPENLNIGIRKYLKEQGYLYAQVYIEKKVQKKVNHCDVYLKIRIQEGPQVEVGKILIRGFQHTDLRAIHKRIRLKTHNVFRPSLVLATQKAISELEVFDNVRVQILQEEKAEKQKDVVITLSERTREYTEWEVGVSTSQGPRTSFKYQHIHLLGKGFHFNARLQFNRQIFFPLFGAYADELTERYANYRGIEQWTKALEHHAQVGMRSPRFPTSWGDIQWHIDAVDQRLNAVMYALDSHSILWGADNLLPYKLKTSFDTSIGFTDLDCIHGENCNFQAELRHLKNRPIHVGLLWKLKLTPLLLWDYRDNPVVPRKGFFTSLRWTYAIGGSAPHVGLKFTPLSFMKYESNFTLYIPGFGFDLAFAARLGFIQVLRSQVPIDERFFLGGRDSIRGFVESALIPQDACLEDPRSLLPKHCNQGLALPNAKETPITQGGNSFALLKSEIRVPLVRQISGAVFVDMGNLWIDIEHARPLKLRVGTGLGIRYTTPVGILAVDIGFNPFPRWIFSEARSQLHFSIGAF